MKDEGEVFRSRSAQDVFRVLQIFFLPEAVLGLLSNRPSPTAPASGHFLNASSPARPLVHGAFFFSCLDFSGQENVVDVLHVHRVAVDAHHLRPYRRGLPGRLGPLPRVVPAPDADARPINKRDSSAVRCAKNIPVATFGGKSGNTARNVVDCCMWSWSRGGSRDTQ